MDLDAEEEDAPDNHDEEFDPDRAQRMLNEMFGNRQLSEAEQRAKQAKYEKECAMGYFLQTITVQKLKQKIFFYDDLVREMETEFKLRVKEKRNAIQRMRLKTKEHGLTEAIMICERCSADIAPIRTFDFVNDDLHYAKCVFGSLQRVDLADAQQNPLYKEDQDFVELYLPEYDNLRAIIASKEKKPTSTNQEPPPRDYGFAKCRNNHILGVVIDKRYYITSVSQVQLLFPNCHYETWDARWWKPGYPAIIALQKQTLVTRQQACANAINKVKA